MMGKLPLRTLQGYVFVSLLLFIVVEFFKYCNFQLPNLFLSHLNDLLTIPLVATLCLHGVWIIKSDRSIRLNSFSILSLVAMYSFYFEYYLPGQSHHYTGDIWDVVCYLCGGIIFYLLQKCP